MTLPDILYLWRDNLCGVHSLEKMRGLPIFHSPHMRRICLKFFAGFLINALVMPNHNDFIPASNKFPNIDMETVHIFRDFGENILCNSAWSNEYAIPRNVWKALAFIPFHFRVEEGQSRFDITF